MSSVAAVGSDEGPGRRKVSRRGSVAGVARRDCRARHQLGAGDLIAGVACGDCWDRAVEADQQFAVLFGLDIAPSVRDESVDEVAVERALAGERLPLNAAEKQEVASRKRMAGNRRRFSQGPVGRLVGLRMVERFDNAGDWSWTFQPREVPGVA